MPIVYQMDDSDLESKLKGYSVTNGASEQVKLALNNYVEELINESKHLEESRHITTTVKPEITATIIQNAMQIVQMGTGTKPVRWKIKILRIFAALLPFITSIIYRMLDLQNDLHKLILVLLIILTIIFVILSVLKD